MLQHSSLLLLLMPIAAGGRAAGTCAQVRHAQPRDVVFAASIIKA
jgi:hypothetical protein